MPVAKKRKKAVVVPKKPVKRPRTLVEDDSDERELKMKKGDADEDVYSEAGRELLEEDDEMETWEQGFIEGEGEGGQLAKDALTGAPLMGDKIIQVKIKGRVYRFANEKNAKKFREKLEKKEE